MNTYSQFQPSIPALFNSPSIPHCLRLGAFAFNLIRGSKSIIRPIDLQFQPIPFINPFHVSKTPQTDQTPSPQIKLIPHPSHDIRGLDPDDASGIGGTVAADGGVERLFQLPADSVGDLLGMPSGEFKRNLLAAINELVNIKPRSDESIKQFGRKILALLMRDCHLNWVDILPLSGKLTNSLDVTSDESSIKEIVSREICSMFDLRPTAALIAKEGDVNIVLFIGITKGHPHEDPRGYGKTTAIVRYALQYRNSRSDSDYVPYVVCADARRPNAFKKLKELSRGRVNGYTPDKEEGAIGGLDKALGSFKKGDHTTLVIMDVNARHLDEIIQKLALMAGCLIIAI
ncbi:hypothetical protein OROHE_009085 [Orobanche hederae]